MGKIQLIDGQAPDNRTRIAGQEEVQGIFLLVDALLNLGNRGAGIFVFGAHLA